VALIETADGTFIANDTCCLFL